MTEKRKLGLKALTLVCSVIVTFLGAVPLMEVVSSAQIIQIIFGSFAAGATLAVLVRDIRKVGGEKTGDGNG